MRRFIEKRATQEAHKKSTINNKETNQFRHSARRTTSFSLHNRRYTEYDAQLRAPGTHWKVSRHNCKGKKVLVVKFSYNTYEEAVKACNRYMMNHPDNPRPISAYKCDYCGKWHIGHMHMSEIMHEENVEILSAS